jgi:hypothetical protein
MSDFPAAALVMITGAYGSFVLGTAFLHATRSVHWPRVPATISGSEIVVADIGAGRTRGESNLEGAAVVRYEYHVDGELFFGSEIQLGPEWWWLAYREIRRYAPGTAIQVAYDPANPECAVIRPGVTWSMGICFAGTTALFLLGVYWGLWSLFASA